MCVFKIRLNRTGMKREICLHDGNYEQVNEIKSSKTVFLLKHGRKKIQN